MLSYYIPIYVISSLLLYFSNLIILCVYVFLIQTNSVLFSVAIISSVAWLMHLFVSSFIWSIGFHMYNYIREIYLSGIIAIFLLYLWTAFFCAVYEGMRLIILQHFINIEEKYHINTDSLSNHHESSFKFISQKIRKIINQFSIPLTLGASMGMIRGFVVVGSTRDRRKEYFLHYSAVSNGSWENRCPFMSSAESTTINVASMMLMDTALSCLVLKLVKESLNSTSNSSNHRIFLSRDFWFLVFYHFCISVTTLGNIYENGCLFVVPALTIEIVVLMYLVIMKKHENF